MSAAIKQAGVDWPTVLKMLAGGAFLGSGIGAGTSYLNQLNNLKEDAAPAEDDKNTLYINLPGQQANTPPVKGTKKRASDENSALTYALGGAGAIGGTYMAYNVIRNAYQNARKRQLQKELDQAHQVYMGKLDDSARLEKGASQFPMLSKGVGMAYLALLAAGVGSGVVANKILDKQMPAIEPPERFEPKKIVIRTKDEPDEEKEAAEKYKGPGLFRRGLAAIGVPSIHTEEEASAIRKKKDKSTNEESALAAWDMFLAKNAPKKIASESEIGPDEIEGLLRHHLESTKRAAASGFEDLVAAVAQGRGQIVEDNIDDLDTLFDMVKGASLEHTDPWKRNLAITWLSTDPEISETIAPVLAAEFADAYPGLFKMAANVEPRLHKSLIGLVKAAVSQTRKAVHQAVWSQIKMADTLFDKFIPEPAENLMLANSLNEMLKAPEDDKKHNAASPALSESPEVKPPTANIEADDDAAAKFLMQHKGDLEKALATAG